MLNDYDATIFVDATPRSEEQGTLYIIEIIEPDLLEGNEAKRRQNEELDMRNDQRKDCDVWKGLAAGIMGGLAASWIMNQFQSTLGKLMEGKERPHGAQSLQDGSPQHGIGRELQKRGSDEEDDNATERMASIVSEDVFGRRLSEDEKKTGGVIAHYAMGVTSGVVYGVAAEFLPAVTAGAGLPFGAAVWVIADEGIVPALGLSKSATEYPLSKHTYALASHLVYGLGTELVRNAVRRVL